MHLQNADMTDRPLPQRETNYIQAWRLRRGMTQAQLAEAVGTTASVISLLENGDRSLSAKWLRRIAGALKTSAGFLLDRHPDDLPTDVTDIWYQIPESQRDQALRVLQAFRMAS